MDESEDSLAKVAATVAATEAAPVARIEIVGERRRADDAAFRARVVSESLVAGARVQELARRHDICASLIYRWRREAVPRVGAGAAVQLVPVRVSEGRQAVDAATAPVRRSVEPSRGEMVEIELPGGVRIRVGEKIGTATLRRIVGALRG